MLCFVSVITVAKRFGSGSLKGDFISFFLLSNSLFRNICIELNWALGLWIGIGFFKYFERSRSAILLKNKLISFFLVNLEWTKSRYLKSSSCHFFNVGTGLSFYDQNSQHCIIFFSKRLKLPWFYNRWLLISLCAHME